MKPPVYKEDIDDTYIAKTIWSCARNCAVLKVQCLNVCWPFLSSLFSITVADSSCLLPASVSYYHIGNKMDNLTIHETCFVN